MMARAFKVTAGCIAIPVSVFVIIAIFAIAYGIFNFIFLDYPSREHPPAKGDFGGRTLPQWTPDGTKIVFSHRGSIYTVLSEGTQLRHIHGWANEDEWYAAPSISPDGSRIAYLKRHRDWWFWEDYHWEVATSALDGSDERVLTDLDEAVANVSWSPDGQTIAFSSMGAIYTMSGDGSGLHPVSNSQVLGEALNTSLPLSWSPDGQNIGFISIVYDTTDEERVVTRTIGVDGSNLKEFVESGLPSWSPDGAHIALMGSSANSVHFNRLYTATDGLYIVTPDGFDQREVVTMPREGVFTTSPISWAPDSSNILVGPYVASTDGSTLLLLPEPWPEPVGNNLYRGTVIISGEQLQSYVMVSRRV